MFKNYSFIVKRITLCSIFFILVAPSFSQLDVFLIEENQPKEKSPNQIIDALNTLFEGRVCSSYFRTRSIKFTSITYSCDGNFTEKDRNNFLKTMFDQKLLLFSSTYKIIKQTGQYKFIFEPDISVKKRVSIELIFHNANELWPHRILDNPMLALYVHDLSNKKDLEKWNNLGIPLSYGVIPGSLNNNNFMQALRSSKLDADIWLSISLEPKLIKSSFNKFIRIDDILEVDITDLSTWLLSSLNSLPNVKGISNRLGSKFTENTLAMRRFLKIFRGKVDYFLDTRTSQQSVAYETAQILSFSSYKRDIDLDFNTKNYHQLQQKWQALLEVLKKNKYAIAIVNAHSSHAFNFLKKNIYSVGVKGIRFVKVVELPFEKK